MSTPSPFDVGRAIGNQGARGFREGRDENLIEQIISQTKNDPEAMQNAIGKILSQVSQERQPMAINYLQNAYKTARETEMQNRQRQAALDAGINPDLPSALQVEQFKSKQKDKRYKNYGLGEYANDSEQPNNIDPSTTTANTQTNQEQPQYDPKNPMARFSDGQLIGLEGVQDREVAQMAKAERKRREAINKEEREDIRQGASETVKMRQDIAQKAQDAQQAIAEKEKMIDLIETGNLDDPTMAAFLEAIPMKLGMRFLSPETVEYKSTLVNGYRDLRNIFKGATRVKEIEILEGKLADIYLTDEQKKSILKSSMNTLQYDILRAEAAAEVEKESPGIKALAFNQKVNEKMKPKIEALANRIIDQQKAIIKDAENRKKIKLNPKDPEDKEIILQILKEAKNDWQKATKIAKEKGYAI